MLTANATEVMKGRLGVKDLRDALAGVGVSSGDTVLCYISLDAVGSFDSAGGPESLLNCLLEAVGEEGAILVPTYTFSFCKQQDFSVNSTPAQGGSWSTSKDLLELARKYPGAVRSRDPIYSVTALGRGAKELLADLPNNCFGRGSIYDRLIKAGAKICTIGVGMKENTFLNHLEEVADHPLRFNKLYTGYIRESALPVKTGWICSDPLPGQEDKLYVHKLEELCQSSGKLRSVQLGAGEVRCVAAADLRDLLNSALAGSKVAMQQTKASGSDFPIELPPNASMEELIQALWRIPRHIVSDGYDAALRALGEQVPLTTHEYPSGTECWSWIIPEKWNCHEAYLETLDGRRLFSYADNPLHVVSYSLPFEGEVSRKELLEHLHVHHKIAEAVPFIFKYYERDWGLCCSKNLRDSLLDDKYRVAIKSDFSYGTLKVGEIIAPGKTDDCIVLCAHLCHPAMVNDDLAGVVVGIKVMQELLRRRDLRYTYRFLILPETIGSVAYLSQNENLIPKMKGGLFLEMLGLKNPHALQLSFSGTTEVDLCCSLALKTHDPFGWTGAYRTIIGNDERQFNSPGVRVPLLSLSRVLPPSSADWPYPEYHSNFDNPELNSLRNLEASRDLVLSMIDTIENNRIPINRFKGEVFCSRFGIFVDPYSNPEGNRELFNVMDLIDGTQSVAQIASKCGISFNATLHIINDLHSRGLVEWAADNDNCVARSTA
jgi:aminopeptidase-like protein/aminoglycoside N3'-acetyltransferase